MKKIKYLIMCLIVILLIIVAILIGIIKNTEQEEKAKYEKEVDEEIVITEGNLNKEESMNKCILEIQEYEYLDNIDLLKSFFENIKNKKNEELYAILDSEFTSENNIQVENCSTKLSAYNNINSFYIKEIYTQSVEILQDTLREINYIKMIIRINGKENNLYTITRKDFENQSYSIEIIDENKYKDYINGKEELNDFKIELNDYNAIKYSETYQGRLCLIMFDDYINSIKNNVENSYYLLNKEYREKRFSDISEYKEYINLNKEKIFKTLLSKFIKSEQNDYLEYICMDDSNNYYIFRITEGMNYSVILDEYTIDIQEAVQKYNKSDIQNKVALNINKFINGINDKNYNYSYSVLADSFKQNKYQNINIFKESIKENFYEENTVTYNEFTQQGSNYVYKITINDKKSNNSKNITIVMKLKEGTEFEMSFSFN